MTDPATVAKPFLSPRTITSLQGMIRRGFATVATFDQPPTILTLYRLDEGTEGYLAQPERWYVLRYDTQRPGDMDREATASTPTGGTLRAFDPAPDADGAPVAADMRVGDRFALPEPLPLDVAAHTGVLTMVFPTRFGIASARWQIDEGSV